jgi:hypothetical protein
MKMLRIILLGLMAGASGNVFSGQCSSAVEVLDLTYWHASSGLRAESLEDSQRWAASAKLEAENTLFVIEDCGCDQAYDDLDNAYHHARRAEGAETLAKNREYLFRAKYSLEDAMLQVSNCSENN